MGLQALPQLPERTEAQNRLIEDAALFIEDSEVGSEMVGYALVVMYADGAERVATYRPKLEALNEGPPRYFGRSLFHAWVMKALESAVAFAEGCDAVNQGYENNGFLPAPPDDDSA